MTKGEKKDERVREEKKYKALVETAPDAIITFDLLGRFTFANPAAARISGYGEEELLGKHFREFLPTKYIPACLNIFQKVLRGQPTPPIEIELIAKDGERVPVEILGRTVKRGKRVVEVIGIAREITERKRAEEALKESEEQFRSLAERSPNMIFINKKGAVVYANEICEEVMGYRREEFYSPDFDFLTLIAPEHKDFIKVSFGRHMRGEEVPPYEYALLTKEGRRIEAILATRLIRYGGETAILGIATDITERKRAEEEARKRLREITVLHKVSEVINSTLDLKEVFQRVVEELSTTFGYRLVDIYLLEEDGLRLQANIGYDEKTTIELIPLERGVIGRVARTGNPAFIPDVTKDLDYIPAYPEITSEVCVPVKRGETLLGTLNVECDEKRLLTHDDLQLLSTLSSHIGVAIENARLYQEEHQQRQQAETLHQAAQALSATLDLQQVLESILSELQKVVPYDSASVQLLKGDRLEIIGGHGFPNLDELLGISFPLNGDNPNRQVMASRAPFIVEDAPAIYRGFGEEPHAPAGIRAWLGVPLLFGDSLIGMIALDKRVPGFYTEKHAHLALGFAAQAAIAIENAKIFEAEQRRAAQLAVINEVSKKAISILDLHEMLKGAASSICSGFGYYNVSLFLLDKERHEAVMETVAGGFEHIAPGGYRQSLDHGIIGWVIRTGRSWLANDVSQDPYYVKGFLEEVLTKSELCVPIELGGEVIGALDIQSIHLNAFDETDVAAMETLSGQIAIAIENARLYEEEQRRSAQRRTIAEVGRRAAAILDMDDLFRQVVDLIAQNFGYYRVHLFQIDPDSQYAVYKAGTGKAGLAIAEEGLRLKVGEQGLVGWVALHGQPLLVNDVSQDTRYYSHSELPDTRSELDVPIRVAEKIIGVLDVQSEELNAFEEGDLDTLQTLAHQLAVAMENARLYEETQRLAITDGLTGLYNLRYFYEALKKEIQRSERYHRSVSLIILDIDDFKAYNDLYGHLAGDDLLRELAQLMSRVTRQTDTLARYGGEEFAIILPETETEGAGFLAERLVEGVREHRFSTQDGQTIGRITISLGVATYPDHADSAKALVDAADKALLRAKQAGRNQLSVCGEELTELEPR